MPTLAPAVNLTCYPRLNAKLDYNLDMKDLPATRLWFPSGAQPDAEDFLSHRYACPFTCLWNAVEDVGATIRQNNRPTGHIAWIKWGAAILDERHILIHYNHSVDRLRDPKS